MWGARLLPFSELLSRTRNGAEIKDVVLSLISELPSSKFVADLLALHFPGSGSGDSRYLDAKLKRSRACAPIALYYWSAVPQKVC